MLQIAFQIERKSKPDHEVSIGGLEPSLFVDEGAAERGGGIEVVWSRVDDPESADKNNIGTG